MSKLTRKEAQVLRFIYEHLREKPLIGVKDIASFFGVSSPSAYEILSRLADKKKLLVRVGRKGYVLTEEGKIIAERLIFTHRVIETVLYKIFGMSPDCACELASHMDYLVEVKYAMNAFKFLKCPTTCPHNKEIPVDVVNEYAES